MQLRFRLRSALLIGVTLIISLAFVVRDASEPGFLHGDAMGYYFYLPATIIYHHPLTFYEFPEEAVTEPNVLYSALCIKNDGLRTKKGYAINQYTYGVALMEAPFFFVAHATTLITAGKANGFSRYYIIGLLIANIIYAMLGLFLVYRILRRRFPAGTALLTTTAIFLGSNLFWFTLKQAGMSHIPLFFLYALLMWTSIRLYEAPRLWRFAMTGLIAGIITVIRPSDVLCLIIPFCYGITSKADARARLVFLRKHWKALLLAMIVFVLPAIPQMVYWKAISDDWILYSYGNQTFHWRHPHILEGLVGGSNGWLAFSPIMIFSVLGLVCWKHYREWLLCIMLLLPLYIYIIYAWYCYNYINGLGSRPMIHLYPLLALPFAAVLQRISSRAFATKVVAAIVMAFFIAVNFSFSTLQARGLLNSEDSYWLYNLNVLFRNHLRYTDLITKDIGVLQPLPGKIRFVRTLAYESYDDSLDATYERDTMAGRRGFIEHLHYDNEHPVRQIRLQWRKADFGDAHWLRCSARVKCPFSVGLYDNHLLVVDVVRNGYYPLWKGLRLENKIGLADSSCEHARTGFRLNHEEPGRWGYVWFFTPLPVRKLKDGDTMEAGLWNPAHHEVYIDDLKLELWR